MQSMSRLYRIFKVMSTSMFRAERSIMKRKLNNCNYAQAQPVIDDLFFEWIMYSEGLITGTDFDAHIWSAIRKLENCCDN